MTTSPPNGSSQLSSCCKRRLGWCKISALRNDTSSMTMQIKRSDDPTNCSNLISSFLDSSLSSTLSVGALRGIVASVQMVGASFGSSLAATPVYAVYAMPPASRRCITRSSARNIKLLPVPAAPWSK
eukprot:4143670-Prymnesium_polylepis.1